MTICRVMWMRRATFWRYMPLITPLNTPFSSSGSVLSIRKWYVFKLSSSIDGVWVYNYIICDLNSLARMMTAMIDTTERIRKVWKYFLAPTASFWAS